MQQNCLLSDSNYRWKSDNSNDSIQNIKSHELLVQNPITKIDNAQQNQKDCQENFGHAQHWYFCLRTNKILIIILDGFFLEVFCHCYQFLIVLCCYNFLNLSLENIFLDWNSYFPGENKTIYKKKGCGKPEKTSNEHYRKMFEYCKLGNLQHQITFLTFLWWIIRETTKCCMWSKSCSTIFLYIKFISHKPLFIKRCEKK